MLGSRCTRSVAKSWQNLGTNTFCQAVLEPVCTLHPPVSPDLLCLVLFSCFPFPSHLLTVQREPSLLCYLPGGGTASDLFSLMPFCLSSVPPFNFFLSSALSSLLVKRLNHLLTPFISVCWGTPVVIISSSPLTTSFLISQWYLHLCVLWMCPSPMGASPGTFVLTSGYLPRDFLPLVEKCPSLTHPSPPI